jgi:hypothetical protein
MSSLMRSQGLGHQEKKALRFPVSYSVPVSLQKKEAAIKPPQTP